MPAKTKRIIVSGARVNFDPRGTAEANTSRDPKNYKSEEAPMRRKRWEARQSTKK